MNCPFGDGCGFSGTRMSLHQHLMDEHADAVERDGAEYVYACPVCGDETRIAPETVDEDDDDTLEGFGNEIRMLAFDAMLDHLEEEH